MPDPEEPTPTQREIERAALRYADDFARGEGDFDLLRFEIRAILEGSPEQPMTDTPKSMSTNEDSKSRSPGSPEPPLDRNALAALIEEGQRNRAAFEAAAGATRVIRTPRI